MFAFETNVLKFFEGLRTNFLNALFEGVTMFGEETLIVILIGILYFAIDKDLAQRIFFITVFSQGVNNVIKNFAKVERPFASGKVSCVRPETATGYSFPSGHTQNFSTWSMTVAQKLKKKFLIILSIILSLLVALSRVYLGAHYPSDVIVGLTLGFFFATVGNIIYDKVENKNNLYLIANLILTPFVIFFVFSCDPHFADLFKVYGMSLGFWFAIKLEQKFAPIDFSVVWWKKAIRVVFAIIIALFFKEVLKLLYFTDIVQVTLIFDMLRYLVMVFAVFGLYPILLKKMKF